MADTVVVLVTLCQETQQKTVKEKAQKLILRIFIFWNFRVFGFIH